MPTAYILVICARGQDKSSGAACATDAPSVLLFRQPACRTAALRPSFRRGGREARAAAVALSICALDGRPPWPCRWARAQALSFCARDRVPPAALTSARTNNCTSLGRCAAPAGRVAHRAGAAALRRTLRVSERASTAAINNRRLVPCRAALDGRPETGTLYLDRAIGVRRPLREGTRVRLWAAVCMHTLRSSCVHPPPDSSSPCRPLEQLAHDPPTPRHCRRPASPSPPAPASPPPRCPSPPTPAP